MRLAGWIAAAGLGLALAACATGAPAPHAGPTATRALTQADTGTVVGTFMRVGGPLGVGGTQPLSIPLMGTVTFSAHRDQTVAVRVSKTGVFSLRLPPGDYLVSGRSPAVLDVLTSGATVETPCTTPMSVTVVAGRTVRVSVVCAVP